MGMISHVVGSRARALGPAGLAHRFWEVEGLSLYFIIPYMVLAWPRFSGLHFYKLLLFRNYRHLSPPELGAVPGAIFQGAGYSLQPVNRVPSSHRIGVPSLRVGYLIAAGPGQRLHPLRCALSTGLGEQDLWVVPISGRVHFVDGVLAGPWVAVCWKYFALLSANDGRWGLPVRAAGGRVVSGARPLHYLQLEVSLGHTEFDHDTVLHTLLELVLAGPWDLLLLLQLGYFLVELLPLGEGELVLGLRRPAGVVFAGPGVQSTQLQ